MSSFRKLLYGSIMVTLSFSSFIFFNSNKVNAIPETKIVTNTNDSGPGSLRQAIEDTNGNANPSDMDVIEFDITGTGVHTIQPLTQLPNITEKVTIDGYTQPGSAVNTAIAPAPLNTVLMIEIDGSNAGEASGLNIDGPNITVRGLVVNDFFYSSIYASNLASNCTIIGNFLNTDTNGTTLKTGPDIDNPQSLSTQTGSSLNVGGSSASSRNVIAGNLNLNGQNNIVQGNYIGVGSDGLTPFASFSKITVGTATIGYPTSPSNSIIGGSASGEMNVIANASAGHVYLTDGGNIVQGNYIGTDYTGNSNPNYSRGAGVIIAFDSNNNLVGGTNPGEGNIIAGVGGIGAGTNEWEFTVFGTPWIPLKNSILGNSIYDIGIFEYPGFGESNLGIDHTRSVDNKQSPTGEPTSFEEQGPTLNDLGDTDTGPNGYINSPVLKTAQQIGNQLTITYDLDAADSPSDEYRIEFFANDESTIFGSGPGQYYLGADTAVSPGTNKTVTLTVADDYINQSLSATTTAIDGTTDSGFGATSEFAQNISIGSATDFDSDGVADSIEDQAPNGGDGNDDGTLDRLQPTVSSFEIDSTGVWETFVTEGCSENGTVASVDIASLAKQDDGKSYPFGLTDFSLNCSRGDTVTVSKYIFTRRNAADFTIRKFNHLTEQYIDVTGGSIQNQTIGDQPVLVASYDITDGGEYDDDQLANGIIVDPVGLATVAGSSTNTPSNNFAGVAVPNTGLGQKDKNNLNVLNLMIISFIFIELINLYRINKFTKK